MAEGRDKVDEAAADEAAADEAAADEAAAGPAAERVSAATSSAGPIRVSAATAAEPADRAAPADRAEPDDPNELDRLSDLGDEILRMAAHLHAGTHRLLVMLADFDASKGWKASGQRSCAHWLHVGSGFDLGACREKVRAARALVHLPQLSQAMSQGALSFAKVRALTRVATPDNESELLTIARAGTAKYVERAVRSWKRFSRLDEAEHARIVHQTRTLSIVPDADGMYEIHGRLDPEVGALLMRAIEAASDALYTAKRADCESVTPALRRADALGLVAERGMATGLGAGLEAGRDAPISGTGAERYQVMLHVDAGTLSQPGEPDMSHLGDGTRVAAETSRRLSCDASVVRVHTNGEGDVLRVGRRTRTISPVLRRALEVRDGGCRFPGCGLRFTDAHHVTHWADGGGTSLDNLLLLCRHHHRLMHEDGWAVAFTPGDEPTFRSPTGFAVRGAPGRVAPGLGTDPAQTLILHNQARGVRPSYRTAGIHQHPRPRDRAPPP